MMFWYGNGGWHPWMLALMWIGMLLFWGLVAWGVIALFRGPGWGRGSGPSDPVKILHERLARGEIDVEEYERRRDLIRLDR
jgi:putative membrane protein